MHIHGEPGKVYFDPAKITRHRAKQMLLDRALYIASLLKKNGWQVTDPEIKGTVHSAGGERGQPDSGDGETYHPGHCTGTMLVPEVRRGGIPMKGDGLKLQILLTNGKGIPVSDKAEKVLDAIRNGRDLFIEIHSADGYTHYVNADRIVEAKEVNYIESVFGRR